MLQADDSRFGSYRSFDFEKGVIFIKLVVFSDLQRMSHVTKSEQLDQKTLETLDSCGATHETWNQITRIWTLPTVHVLGMIEPARFNELKRRIKGISATSLAERLSQLEKSGVLQRKVYADV